MENKSELEKFRGKSPWLFGDSFIKRAFAIWGHMMAAYLLAVIAIWIVALAMGGFLSVFNF